MLQNLVIWVTDAWSGSSQAPQKKSSAPEYYSSLLPSCCSTSIEGGTCEASLSHVWSMQMPAIWKVLQGGSAGAQHHALTANMIIYGGQWGERSACVAQ